MKVMLFAWFSYQCKSHELVRSFTIIHHSSLLIYLLLVLFNRCIYDIWQLVLYLGHRQNDLFSLLAHNITRSTFTCHSSALWNHRSKLSIKIVHFSSVSFTHKLLLLFDNLLFLNSIVVIVFLLIIIILIFSFFSKKFIFLLFYSSLLFVIFLVLFSRFAFLVVLVLVLIIVAKWII